MNQENCSLLLIVDDIHLGGGGERVAVNMANHYIDEKWHVEFVSFRQQKEEKPYDLSDKAKINYLNVTGNKITQKIKALIRLDSFLQQHSFTFTVAIGSHPSTILGLTRNKCKYSVGTEHLHYFHAPKVWNCLRKWSYKNLDAITVLTYEDLPVLRGLNKNTHVIPNALSMLPTNFAQMKNHNFLAVGRLSEVKQFNRLIEVYRNYVQHNTGWILTIIGDGDMKEKLESLISEYGLEKYVILKPFTQEIEKEYLQSSVLVSTSRSEGLPMVMIEAQSYGLPIVSYDCKTGPRDIVIDGKDGILVKLNDESALLNALLEISTNADLRERMSENAREDAKRFSPAEIYGKWDRLFKSLIK